MYHGQLKLRTPHAHLPDAHHMGLSFGHLVTDPRFWPSVILITIYLLLLLTIAFLTEISRY